MSRLWIAGGALLLGLLSACGSSDSSGTPNTASYGGQGEGIGAPVPAPQAPAADKAQGEQASAPVQERKLVQTARMDLTVPDPFAAISSARAIATGTGGFTGQEEASGDRASITLRIPADRFDSALKQLAELGKVNSQHKQADDVTEQVVDIEARLSTQRASVDRMRALLARAASVSEIAQIENELTRREAELESLQGRRDALAGKVALSTVVIQVTKEQKQAAPVEASSPGFVDGLDGGWGAFGAFVGALATALGAALPFLVAFGIPVGLYFWLRRRRRRAAAAQPASP
jgi:hypothetical protein